MKINLISWCTIVTIVLLCKLDRVSCSDSNPSLKNTSDHDKSQHVSSETKRPPPKPPDPTDQGQDSNETLITVDIDLRASTNEVTYEHDASKRTHRLTCRSGYLIEKVTKGGNVVWQPKDGRHGDRLVIKETDNGPKAKVYRPGEAEGSSSKAQSEAESESVSVSKQAPAPKPVVQPVTATPDAKPVSQTAPVASQVKAQPVESTPGQQVSTTDPAKSTTPASGTDSTTDPTAQAQGNETLITVDIDLRESTNEVTYEHDASKRTHRLTCRSGYLIEKVTKGGTVVWEPKDGRHGDRLVIKETDNGPKAKVYRPGEAEGSSSKAQSEAESESDSVSKQAPAPKPVVQPVTATPDAKPVSQTAPVASQVKAQPVESTPGQQVSTTDPAKSTTPASGTDSTTDPTAQAQGNETLITVDIDLRESTNEVTYEHDASKRTHRLTCRSGYLIEKVTKGGTVVWEPKDGRHGDRLVIKETDNGPKAKVYRPGEAEGSSSKAQSEAESESDSVSKQAPAPKPVVQPVTATPDAKPVSQTAPVASQVKAQPVESTPGQQVSTTDPAKSTTPASGTVSTTDPTAQAQGNETLISVDMDLRESNDYVEYEHDQPNRTHRLRCRTGYLIKEVTKKGKVVWSPKDGRNGDRVVIKETDNRPKAKVYRPGETEGSSSKSLSEAESESESVSKQAPAPKPVAQPAAPTPQQAAEVSTSPIPAPVVQTSQPTSQPVSSTPAPGTDPDSVSTTPGLQESDSSADRTKSDLQLQPSTVTPPSGASLGFLSASGPQPATSTPETDDDTHLPDEAPSSGVSQGFLSASGSQPESTTPKAAEKTEESIETSSSGASPGFLLASGSQSESDQEEKEVLQEHVDLPLSDDSEEIMTEPEHEVPEPVKPEVKKMPIESPDYMLPYKYDFDITKYFGDGETKHPIVLNIGMRFSTLLMEYTKEDNLHIFTPKDVFVFGWVEEKRDIIWTHGYPDVYSVKVELSDDYILKIYLTDGETTVLQKVLGVWEKISSDDADVEEDEYHFSQEVVSAGIYCLGRKVWKYEEGEEYNGVNLFRVGGTLTLNELKGNPDLTKPCVDIYTLGSQHPNDEKKYYFIQSSDNEGLYIFRKNVKCTQVAMNGVTIWNHYRSVYGASYPRAVSYYSSSEVHIHFYNYILLLLKRHKVWTRWIDKDGKFIKSSYIPEPKDEKEDVAPEPEPEPEPEPVRHPKALELDITLSTATKDISYGTFNDTVMFILGEECGFNHVCDDEAFIWRSDDPDSYASQVEYNKSNGTVNICSRNGSKKTYKKKSEGVWDLVFSRPIIERKITKPTLPVASTVISSPISMVALDINNENSTDDFDLNRDDDLKIFEAKSHCYFTAVKHDSVKLWEADSHDESQCAFKVECAKRHSGTRDVTIHWGDRKKRLFVLESEAVDWNEIDLSITNLKSMNINYEHDTHFYLNTLDNGVRTFEARDGFAFNHVKCKSGNDSFDIWKTDNPDEYAYIVIKANDTRVTIHFNDGSCKVFNRGTDGSWTEYSDPSAQQTEIPASESMSVPGPVSISVPRFVPMTVSDTATVPVTDPLSMTVPAHPVSIAASDTLAPTMQVAPMPVASIPVASMQGASMPDDSVPDGSMPLAVSRGRRDSTVSISDFCVSETIGSLSEGGETMFLELQPDVIKIVTVDSNGFVSTNGENTFVLEENDEEVVYTFDENNKCIKVEFKDKLVWQYDRNKDVYPKSVSFILFTTFVIIEFDDGYKIMGMIDGIFKSVTSSVFKRLLKTGIDSQSKGKESADNQSQSTEEPEPVPISEAPSVTVSSQPVSLSSITPKATPISMSISVASPTDPSQPLQRARSSSIIQVATPVKRSELSTVIKSVKTSTAIVKAGSLSSASKGVKQPTSGDQSETSGDSQSAASTPKTGVDLNLTSDTQSTAEFDYKKVRHFVTYTAKGLNAFKLVKDDEVNVWETTDACEYCSKVEVELMGESKIVTVFLPNDKSRIFKFDDSGDLYTEIDTSKVNPKIININYQHESHAYKNELKNNIRTFTAKYGFAFKGANEFVGGIKVEIWKTVDESEYANKIVNEGGNRVIIHIGEGTGASTKGFSKGTDGNWAQTALTVPSTATDSQSSPLTQPSKQSPLKASSDTPTVVSESPKASSSPPISSSESSSNALEPLSSSQPPKSSSTSDISSRTTPSLSSSQPTLGESDTSDGQPSQGAQQPGSVSARSSASSSTYKPLFGSSTPVSSQSSGTYSRVFGQSSGSSPSRGLTIKPAAMTSPVTSDTSSPSEPSDTCEQVKHEDGKKLDEDDKNQDVDVKNQDGDAQKQDGDAKNQDEDDDDDLVTSDSSTTRVLIHSTGKNDDSQKQDLENEENNEDGIVSKSPQPKAISALTSTALRGSASSTSTISSVESKSSAQPLSSAQPTPQVSPSPVAVASRPIASAPVISSVATPSTLPTGSISSDASAVATPDSSSSASDENADSGSSSPISAQASPISSGRRPSFVAVAKPSVAVPVPSSGTASASPVSASSTSSLPRPRASANGGSSTPGIVIDLDD